MGVLGDDDIEKLEKSYKKRNTWKVFHDPIRASNLWSNTLLALVLVGVVAFMASMIAVASIEMNDQNEKLYENLKVAVLDNSDCDSLNKVYQNIDDENTWLKQSIKDEIKFRCG